MKTDGVGGSGGSPIELETPEPPTPDAGGAAADAPPEPIPLFQDTIETPGLGGWHGELFDLPTPTPPDAKPAAGKPGPAAAPALASDPKFQALPEATQKAALQQIAKHAGDAAATATLTALVKSPGFGQLPAAEQGKLLNLVGGQNAFISKPERQALDTLLKSAAFTGADAAGQCKQLRDFMTAQAATPMLVSQNGSALPRAPYTCSEAKDAGEVTFTSGKAAGVTRDVKIGDQSIKVTLPKNPPAGSNLPTIDEVAKGLAALPPASRALVKEVMVEPNQNPSDSYWATKYGDPNFRSYMTAGSDGVVNIYPTTHKQTQTVLEQSMIHETGHVLSRSKWGQDGDARWDDWKKAITSDGVVASRYAKNSQGEDFAESLTLYMNVKGTDREAELRALMPERFKLLDKLLAPK